MTYTEIIHTITGELEERGWTYAHYGIQMTPPMRTEQQVSQILNQQDPASEEMLNRMLEPLGLVCKRNGDTWELEKMIEDNIAIVRNVYEAMKKDCYPDREFYGSVDVFDLID